MFRVFCHGSFVTWGAQKISFIYADLGPEQNFPHAYLSGFKWSLQPLSFIEVGFTFLTQSGGEGSPPASFGERVKDVLPVGQLLDQGQIQIGNKFGGFELRFRIPTAQGLEIYLEGAWDDTPDERLIKDTGFLLDAGAYIVGFYAPRLNNVGTLGLRLELHYLGPRLYRHSQFISGWTLNQFLLGDNLGPDANGVYFWFDWEIDSQNRLVFNPVYESRSGDLYGPTSGKGTRHIKIADLPNERRYRLVTEWYYQLKDLPMILRVILGYERVQNFNFTAGNDLNNFLGRVNFQIFFDRQTRFPRTYQ